MLASRLRTLSDLKPLLGDPFFIDQDSCLEESRVRKPTFAQTEYNPYIRQTIRKIDWLFPEVNTLERFQVLDL